MNMNLAIVGFLAMIVCQDIVAIKAMKKSMREGVLCLIIPGYIFIYANREGLREHAKPLIGWLIGAVLIVLGAVMR